MGFMEYSDLSFVGFFGLLDPPRKGVGRAIASCHGAGIRVIMVNGDQPVTARHIGVDLARYGRETGSHRFIPHPCIRQAVARIQYEG